MKNFKNFFLHHTILSIYLVVFIFLCFGVFKTSGVVYLPMLLYFLIPLLLFYFLGNNIVAKIGTRKTFNLNFVLSYKSLLPIIVFLFVGHVISMSGLPAFECYEITHLSEAVELRRGITTRAHPIWNYISSINIKALIPFSLVLFWHKKQKKLFWILIIVGCLYSFTLMQKSYIFSVLIPVITISIYEKKWLDFFKFSISIFIVIISLVYVTNPQIRGGVDDLKKVQTEEKTKKSNAIIIFTALCKRVFVVPGEMVSEWFRCIPEKKPFLHGNGYNIISKIKKEEFHDYALELYPIIKPKMAKKGLKGSVNVASFMREYSNFGIIGLVLSGLITALFFLFIEFVYKDTDIKIKLALNLFLIFLLSSGALSTLLLSGGWLFLIGLFFIFKKEFNEC